MRWKNLALGMVLGGLLVGAGYEYRDYKRLERQRLIFECFDNPAASPLYEDGYCPNH